jgi:hypothetical protein
MMAKRKCSINNSIKSEYLFISVNENVECTLCNAKFFIAHGAMVGRRQSIFYRVTASVV